MAFFEHSASFRAYATLVITQNDSEVITMIGTGDDRLLPPEGLLELGSPSYGGYYKVTGFEATKLKGFYFDESTQELVTLLPGEYSLPVAWGSFIHSQNNSVVSFVAGVTRGSSISFSQRPTPDKVPNVGDPGLVSGGGTLTLQKGDRLSFWTATDISGDLLLRNANITIESLEVY